MAIAYVLIITAPQKDHQIYSELKRMNEVVEVYPLFGDYDLIAKIEGESVEALGRVVLYKIGALPGVVHTETLTVIEEF
ncbi:MAG: Lrp/AsnC ligand binding domain-containing protein [Methanomassiliicoccales archaeon]|jgi:DNA-binding Lrp family transcriptional regulator|nr:Lrp/AsnC ligand binding domain-containing protein [Methanomassiliicoccales archaeon]MDH7508853.1 Lrp/AsnC ligand binding domain-containing protein [Methanomassiliicoccales archaeon]